jgi:hypothetical protein
VDESAARYYMRFTMRLLLLFSAFLTAMVGVGTPAAAVVRPACEVSATASVRAERQAPRIAIIAPDRFGRPDATLLAAAALPAAPARSMPLYAGRLRV